MKKVFFLLAILTSVFFICSCENNSDLSSKDVISKYTKEEMEHIKSVEKLYDEYGVNYIHDDESQDERYRRFLTISYDETARILRGVCPNGVKRDYVKDSLEKNYIVNDDGSIIYEGIRYEKSN